MARAAKTTTDHDEIRRWVEARGGHPAHVVESAGRNDPGILRIDYPGFSGEDTLEPIEWDEFFDSFDRNNLAFLYQDSAKSRFSKLVERGTSSSTKRSSTKKAGTKKRAASSSRKATASKKAVSTKKASSKKTASKKSATSKKSTSRKSPSKKSTAKKSASRTSTSKKSSKHR